MTKNDIMLFADFEASALSGGYPIQIGFAWLNLSTGTVKADGRYIRPAPDWADLYWDEVAEGIHSLTHDFLMEEGTPVLEVADWAWNHLAGVGVVYCDAPEFDAHWLGQLLDHARGDTTVRPQIRTPPAWMDKDAVIEERGLQAHDAVDDAIALAIACAQAMRP